METSKTTTTDAAATGRRHSPRPPRRAEPIRAARRLLHVRRAFGEPVVQEDVTLVPVARVWGGSGYGDGGGEWGDQTADRAATGNGSGGGFGVRVSPVGVYVVRGAEVTWQPALDLTRVVVGGQVLGALALVLVSRALRRRRR